MNIEDKRYGCIVADPPWKYYTWGKNTGGKSAESHYRTMTLQEICDLPVGSIAADDCTLFLWATFPNLTQAFEVIEAWGFQYKTVGFVWVKTNRKAGSLFWGLGYWTRANAEVCLLATKGCPKRMSKSVHQVVLSPIQRHSQKPDEVQKRIEQLMGNVPKAELFARRKLDGWDAWGNEVDSDFVFLPGVASSA